MIQADRGDKGLQKERRKLHDFNALERQLAEELRKLDKGQSESAGVKTALVESERRDNQFHEQLTQLMGEFNIDDQLLREIIRVLQQSDFSVNAKEH